MLSPKISRVIYVSTSVAVTFVVLGCGEPVREDRAIEFSRDGGHVAFQHGNEGVYVADRQGGGLTKIFQPDANVLATSRPLANPKNGQLIFATAEMLDEKSEQPTLTIAPSPADGQLVGMIPVRFTCWLRNEPTDDQPPAVQKLFNATCGHLGYISAGLVVRWHPDGDHVLYVAHADDGSGRHSVFEYDLATKATRRAFPFVGDAVLCDWTPDGRFLVCIVGNIPSQGSPNPSAKVASPGIWIGKPDDETSWWHVSESEQLSPGQLPSLIESLRASRPAWTQDGSQFAFVSSNRPEHETVKRRLQRVTLADRVPKTVLESPGLISDLFWSPDGQRLGFVLREAEVPASLKILESDGSISTRPTNQPPRKFAGFDATSRRLAYIATQPMERPRNESWWALLLLPDPLARDSAWIADVETLGSDKEVFAGTRVTFPLWSPTEERLSLWLTFTPRYRSLLSIFRRWGLWPGDPAATIDTASGEISWMAVSPQEELQIGHFHLLKRDYSEAWRWYAQGRAKLPSTQPPQSWPEFTQRIGAPENSKVFEYLCLKRLGRDDEAAKKWREFDEDFFPQPGGKDADSPDNGSTEALLGVTGLEAELLKRLVHDLFVAEVFLSVDAVEDALTHFRDERPTQNDATALSHAIVVAQLLLISDDPDGYVSHCTSALAPLVFERAKWPENPSSVFSIATGLCVAPLFRADFLSRISTGTLQECLPIWREHRTNLERSKDDGLSSMAADLVIRAAALVRGDDVEAQAGVERIRRNSMGRTLIGDRPIDDVVKTWFDWSQSIVTSFAGLAGN